MLYRLDYSETKNKQNREHSFSIWPLYILPKKWEININTFDYYVGFFTTKIWDHTVKINLKEKWNTINIASQKLCLHKRNFQINRTYLGIVFQQNFKHFLNICIMWSFSVVEICWKTMSKIGIEKHNKQWYIISECVEFWKHFWDSIIRWNSISSFAIFFICKEKLLRHISFFYKTQIIHFYLDSPFSFWLKNNIILVTLVSAVPIV